MSGAGNVAQYTVEKLIELGAKPVTMSDSDGYIYDPDGIDAEKLAYIKELKNVERGRISEYAEEYGVKYVAGAKPWFEKADIALPSATQNEINEEAAKALIANGVFAVSEGANMPSTPEAIKVFQDAKILYSPGKAANAGGVAVSGLEMSQNSERLRWSREEVDAKLHDIMNDIHDNCVKYGTEAEVRTEVVDLDAAIDITVAVNRNLVVADLNVITVSGSNILLQPVTMSRNLNQLVATHREAGRYEERA